MSEPCHYCGPGYARGGDGCHHGAGVHRPARTEPDGETETLTEVLDAIKWKLDHYGPRDAEPFQFSRYESPAHAALDAVLASDWLAARDAENQAKAWREGAAAGHHSPLTWYALRQANPYLAALREAATPQDQP